jgi:hypothetical protein
MTTKEASGLTEIVAQVIENHRREPEISPSWIATEAMSKLNATWMLTSDRDKQLVYKGCHLELRQIARSLLRNRFEPEEDVDKLTHPLFPELQLRYPVTEKEDAEPRYVLLESLGHIDWKFNVRRLRADAGSRLKHADALEAWGMNKFGRAAPLRV